MCIRSWGDLRGIAKVWAPVVPTKTQFLRLPKASSNPQTQAQFQLLLSSPLGGQEGPASHPYHFKASTHLRTNLEVNLLKMLPEAPRRPWLLPEGEAGVTP